VVHDGYFGLTPPRTWQAVAKAAWHTPSWLTLQEIRQSLDHYGLEPAQLHWD
jgi:hypothetical protein